MERKTQIPKHTDCSVGDIRAKDLSKSQNCLVRTHAQALAEEPVLGRKLFAEKLQLDSGVCGVNGPLGADENALSNRFALSNRIR